MSDEIDSTDIFELSRIESLSDRFLLKVGNHPVFAKESLPF